MANPNTLNLDNIVNVTVEVAGGVAMPDGFNVGLILGSSGRVTLAERCKAFLNLDEMIESGFEETDPEYEAAAVYFAQVPTPRKVIIGAINATGENAETALDAVKACYAKTNEWYGFYICDLADADIEAVAHWTMDRRLAFFYQTSDPLCKDASNKTDIGTKLKDLKCGNAFGLYASAPHAVAGVMGYAMGANDGSDNSAYTLAYKRILGVETDDLSAADVAALTNKNLNYYVTRAGTYDVLQKGVCADGTPFDEVIGLHELANQIQRANMDVLSNVRKVPQSDSGVKQFVVVTGAVCADYVRKGFLAPGVWTGANVLSLKTGDALTAGYLVQSGKVADQPIADRKARKAPPLYVCAKLAGAIEGIVIKVTVDQ